MAITKEEFDQNSDFERPTGRPPIHGESMRQTNLFMTAAQKRYLRRAAAIRGMSVSAYVRILIQEDQARSQGKWPGESWTE